MIADIIEAPKYFLVLHPDDTPPNSKVFQGLSLNLFYSVSGEESFFISGILCMAVPTNASSSIKCMLNNLQILIYVNLMPQCT